MLLEQSTHIVNEMLSNYKIKKATRKTKIKKKERKKKLQERLIKN